MSPRLFAVLLSVAVEAPIVAAFYPRRRLRMATVAAVATSATNVAMNLLLPHWESSAAAFLFLGEGASFAVEAIVYALGARPLDLPRALAASAFANATSFAFGAFL
jgi:hypothetical protein